MSYNIEVKEIPSSFSSHDEYHEYLMCEIRNGKDVDKNIDLLFRSTYRLGYNKLKRWSGIEEDTDNLLSLMSIAFMKTVNNYTIKQNKSFCALYTVNIRNEISMEYYHRVEGERVLKNDCNKLFFLSLDNDNDNENDGYYNIVNNKYLTTEEKIENKLICRQIFDIVDDLFIPEKSKGKTAKNLSRNKEIFITYLKNRMNDEKLSTDEIGFMFGINGSSARKIIREYKNKLKKELSEIGIEGW